MELKPCPFCGKEAMLGYEMVLGHRFEYACCPQCGANRSIDLWNTRHTPDPEPLKIEELKEGDEVRVTGSVSRIDAFDTGNVVGVVGDDDGWFWGYFHQSDLDACNAEKVEE